MKSFEMAFGIVCLKRIELKYEMLPLDILSILAKQNILKAAFIKLPIILPIVRIFLFLITAKAENRNKIDVEKAIPAAHNAPAPAS